MARQAVDPDEPSDALPAAVRRAFRDGDPAAFERVLHRCQTPLYRMALRMVADAGTAEDLVQEALIRAFRKRGFYDPERPLEPWLYRTAMNVFLNAVSGRSRPEETSLDALAGLSWGGPAAASPGDPLARRDDAERVRALLPELPPEHRAVIALRYTEDLDIESIAEILGRPVGTVKTILFRSREFLRARLAEAQGNP